MTKFDWDLLDYLTIGLEKLEKLKQSYLNLGWDYQYDFDNPSEAFSVITPDKREITIKDIEKTLQGKLIFKDKEQITAIKAADFLQILRALGFE